MGKILGDILTVHFHKDDVIGTNITGKNGHFLVPARVAKKQRPRVAKRQLFCKTLFFFSKIKEFDCDFFIAHTRGFENLMVIPYVCYLDTVS